MNIYELEWNELFLWIRQVVPTVERYNQLVTDGEKDSDEVQLAANALCSTVKAVKRVLNPPASQSENLPPGYDLRRHYSFSGPTGLVSRFEMFRDLLDEVLRASGAEVVAHSQQDDCFSKQKRHLRAIPASTVDALEDCLRRLAGEVPAHLLAVAPDQELETVDRINREWACFAASLNKVATTRVQDPSANTSEYFWAYLSPNPDVRDLARHLEIQRESGNSMNEIAREFTGETPDSCPKANSLLSHIRRLRKKPLPKR